MIEQMRGLVGSFRRVRSHRLRFILGSRAIDQYIAVWCGWADDALVANPAGAWIGIGLGIFELGLGVGVYIFFGVGVGKDVYPRAVVRRHDDLMAGSDRDD